MNGSELARKLGTSTRKVGWLISTGQIKAERVKQAWLVDEASVRAFQRRNKTVVDNIKKRYVELYWAGATVERLQARAKDEFAERGVIWPLEGFAEKAIYESIMQK